MAKIAEKSLFTGVNRHFDAIFSAVLSVLKFMRQLLVLSV